MECHLWFGCELLDQLKEFKCVLLTSERENGVEDHQAEWCRSKKTELSQKVRLSLYRLLSVPNYGCKL